MTIFLQMSFPFIVYKIATIVFHLISRKWKKFPTWIIKQLKWLFLRSRISDDGTVLFDFWHSKSSIIKMTRIIAFVFSCNVHRVFPSEDESMPYKMKSDEEFPLRYKIWAFSPRMFQPLRATVGLKKNPTTLSGKNSPPVKKGNR